MSNPLATSFSRKKLSPTSIKRSCFFSGGKIHPINLCPARGITSHSCGKIGHYSKVCKSQKSRSTTVTLFTTNLCAITASVPESLAPATTRVLLNGHTVNALLDTGSSESFIDARITSKLRIKIKPLKKEITMALATLNTLTSGFCVVDLHINKLHYKSVKLKVLKNLCCDIILGQDFQKQHAAVTFVYGGTEPELEINKTKIEICSLTASKLRVPRLLANLKPHARPIATKSRRYRDEDRQFIAQEVKHLLAEGIVEPSSSPWRAQVVIVKDEFDRHKKRMCVDYSNTVNLFTELDAYPLPRIDTLVNKLASYRVFSTFDLKSAYYQLPLSEEDKPFTAFEADGRLYQFTCIPFGVTNGVATFQRAIDKFVDEENLINTFVYLDNITVAGKTQAEHDECVKSFLEAAQRQQLTLNEKKSVCSVNTISVLGYEIGGGLVRPDKSRLQPLLDLEIPTNKASLIRTLGMFAYYAKWIPRFSDRIRPLNKAKQFPLDTRACEAFHDLKQLLVKAALHCPDNTKPYVIECDASDVAISATLNQFGRPVAFMSRTLNRHETHYPAIEKEATAVIEAVRKWSYFLSG